MLQVPLMFIVALGFFLWLWSVAPWVIIAGATLIIWRIYKLVRQNKIDFDRAVEADKLRGE